MTTSHGPGIYAILNRYTGDYYIGSSNNIAGRWLQHKSALNRRTGSYIFQSIWDELGEEAFCFVVLENVPDDWLLLVEQMYLTQYQPAYNTNESAYGFGPPPQEVEEPAVYRHVTGHGHPCGICHGPVGDLELALCSETARNAIPLHFDCFMERLSSQEEWATFRERYRTPRPLITIPTDPAPDAQVAPAREETHREHPDHRAPSLPPMGPRAGA